MRALAALVLLALAGCRGSSPDVLVILVDTLRADRLGPYGGPKGLTPFIDRLAASGVTFANAYSTSSWTNPAVASLFTSRYPSQHRVTQFGSRLSDAEVTLAERLAAARYRRVGIVGNFRLLEALGFGQGFDAWFPLRIGAPKPPAWHLVQDAIRFYDRQIAPRPWSRWSRRPLFLYMHFMDPHAPYAPPPAARAGRVGAPPEGRSEAELTADLLDVGRWDRLSAADVAYLHSLYDAEIAAFDARLARFFARLRSRRLLDHTVVVLMADHGEEFREHGSLTHGTALFGETVRVPLIMAGPGLPAGRVVHDDVSIVDVAPTLLALLGVAPEPRFEGRSLLPLLAAPGAPADVVLELEPVDPAFETRRHTAGLVHDGLALLLSTSDDAALYDLRADPGETRPNPPAVAAEVAALRRRLAERRTELATRASAPESIAIGKDVRDRLRALGYAH